MALDIQKKWIPLALTPPEEHLFALLAECATAMDCPIYVIGGFVRDKIIGRNSKDKDTNDQLEKYFKNKP
jgi:tRNA nucleotidyltransferase/poly(A) polymerase